MGNGIKVTLRNAFTDNTFALENKKQSKNDERTFETACVLLTWLLTLRQQMPHICRFQDSVSPFLTTSCCF